MKNITRLLIALTLILSFGVSANAQILPPDSTGGIQVQSGLSKPSYNTFVTQCTNQCTNQCIQTVDCSKVSDCTNCCNQKYADAILSPDALKCRLSCPK